MGNYFRPGTYALVPNKQLLPEMKGAPLSVYITLCAHADAEGICFPGIKRLSETTGYDRRTIFRSLTKLIELGVIERHNRLTDKGDMDSNLYRILLATPISAESKNVTTQSLPRHRGSDMDDTTRSDTHDTLTNPIELTQLTKDDNKKIKAEDNRGKPSATAERMRKAQQQGLKPWEYEKVKEPTKTLKPSQRRAIAVKKANRQLSSLPGSKQLGEVLAQTKF